MGFKAREKEKKLRETLKMKLTARKLIFFITNNKIPNLENNIPDKIWLPWKHQDP